MLICVNFKMLNCFSVALLQVFKSLIDLLLTTRQVTIQEKKGCVVIVKSDTCGAFVCCHPVHASLNFRCVHALDTAGAFIFGEEHYEAAEHDLPHQALESMTL